MIKDIEEAIYYCAITKAMNEQEKEKERYYTEKMYPDYYRDMDRPYEKRYYAGGGSMRGNSGSYNGNTGSRAYLESYPMMRDYREGKSPISRKTYMETKETHQGHEVQMKELNKYEVIKELVDHNGNKIRAKEKLGLSIRQINRLIKIYKEKGKSRFRTW